MLKLKAKDIEKLENTSFAHAMVASVGEEPPCGGPCTSYTYIVCREETEIGQPTCTYCSVGTVCTFSGSCCTGVTDGIGTTGTILPEE